MLDLALIHRLSLETGYSADPEKPLGIDLSGGQIIGLHKKQSLLIETADFAYQSPKGLAHLIECYAEILHGGTDVAESTIVTVGAKQALFLAFSFLAPKARRVLVPSPGWMPYKMLPRALGIELIEYDPRDIYELIRLIRKNAKSLIVANYPHNPTGVCLNDDELAGIVGAIDDTKSHLISDEVYRALVVRAPSAMAHIQRGCVTVVDSVSKWAGAAGLRVGFLTGSQDLLKYSLSLIGSMNSGTSSLAQSWTAKNMKEERMVEIAQAASASSLNALERDLAQSGYCVISKGAIYLWVKGGPTFELEENRIFGAPGELFGAKNLTRLCPTASSNPWNKLMYL